jgi:transcriptional regulator GlxA family with amidase domain
VLAKLGLLQNKKATTHWAALELLSSIDDSIDIQTEQRFVDDGVITSAGVSAGIDMSLAVVEKLHGLTVANDTARYMEYRWNR